MKRPWFVRYDQDGQTRICDPDFTYDVELVVTGDFPSQEQRSEFAKDIAKRLSLSPEGEASNFWPIGYINNDGGIVFETGREPKPSQGGRLIYITRDCAKPQSSQSK